MRKSFLDTILFVTLLTFAFFGEVSAEVSNYSLNKKTDYTDDPSFIELNQFIKPDYSIGTFRPSVRLTINPGSSFDGKITQSSIWMMPYTSNEFTGLIQDGTYSINYSLNGDKKQKQLLEQIPFIPYFHFESGNSSAGILFWVDKVNMFWKLDF